MTGVVVRRCARTAAWSSSNGSRHSSTGDTEAIEALFAWLDAFVAHVATKRPLALAATDVPDGRRTPMFEEWHAAITTTASALVRRAQPALRQDITATDVLALASGAALTTDVQNARRLLAGAPLEFDPMRFDTWEDCVGTAHEFCGLMLIHDGFVQALTELPDERIPAVAATWATADEWQRWDEPWAPGELDATVLGLRDLARTARTTGQRMYVWFEG